MSPRTSTADVFTASVEPLLGQLYARAVRLSGDTHDADDLVQETVLRAWRFWPRFEQGTNLRAWLLRILTRCFIDGYHRGRREREVLSLARHAHPDAAPAPWQPDECGLSDEVEASVSALPTEFRSVLRLVALEDRSYREAADVLGCPVGTVMSRLHRARRSLKADLGSFAAQAGYC